MAQWVFLVKKHVYEPEAQVHNTHIVLSRMVSISWSILLMGPDTIKRPGKGEFSLLELICLFFLPSHICTFDFEGWGGGQAGAFRPKPGLKIPLVSCFSSNELGLQASYYMTELYY